MDTLQLKQLVFAFYFLISTTCICLYSTLTHFVGKFVQFNISWIRAGHPLLNVGDLSIEATQSLGLLLDRLRFPTVKSLSNAETIVLINR